MGCENVISNHPISFDFYKRTKELYIIVNIKIIYKLFMWRIFFLDILECVCFIYK